MGKKPTLDMSHPELAREWHPTKNDGLKPNEVTFSSHKKPWWICHKNHYWQAVMHNRKNGAKCPYCANQKAGFGNDLKTNYPEIAKLWHPIKNGNLKPSDVLPGTHRKAWWICEKGHEHEQNIYGKMQGKGCAYCDGKKIGYGNDLKTNYPDIAKLWHPTKNGNLKPDMVTPGSSKKVWWICKKGHEHFSAPKSKHRFGKCPYCLNFKVGYGNDLETKYPEIAGQWHPTKNGDKKPKDYVFATEKSFWWICDYGHEWKTSVKARTRVGTNCPKCSNQTSKIEVYIFSELKSIFKSVTHRKKKDGREIDIFIDDISLGIEYDGYFWHKQKRKKDEKKFLKNARNYKVIRVREYPLKKISNNDLIIKYSDDFQKMFLGIIEHILFKTKLSTNVKNDINSYLKIGTPQNIDYYESQIAGLPGPIFVDSLEYNYPDIIKLWSSKNKLPPSKFSPGSSTKVWWLCKKGHEYDMAIYLKTSGHGCPYCSNRRIGYGNDFSSTHPKLASEWHPTKNKNLRPSEVSFGSSRKVWWLCNKGHNYKQSIGERTGGKKLACPYCSGKKLGYGNDFAALYPKLVKEWHPTKNGSLKPEKIRHGSPRNVWWICPKGHSYQRVVGHRTNLGYGCVFCSKRQTVLGYGNDLKSMHPDIAKDWHPSKNGELSPERVLSKSKQKAWFKCSKGHDYYQEIYYLTKGHGCPYCSGRKIGYGNDFATLYPDLAKEWHPTKNTDLNPSKISAGSQQKVWWICNKDHEFEAHIRNRTKKKSKCPYCTGKKAGYGNDFATLYPKLAKEWHPIKNGSIKPNEIRPRTNNKRWWLCDKKHEWQQSTLSRINSKNRKCKEC
tara:strand:+ start:82 stop:2586 length:2505 start_codon:yes stop_codon:yes gene_type:complete